MQAEPTQPQPSVLSQLQEAAEAQLLAALRMDIEGLSAATEQRAALLDVLAVSSQTIDSAALEALHSLDTRLGRLLSAGGRVLSRLLQSRPGATYDSSGKMRDRTVGGSTF